MAETDSDREISAAAAMRWFALAALTLLVVRVAGLFLSPFGLHPDEAQYWSWAQTLDWGYFSKPPLVAWTIAATTALFGDAPWAVRLAAPFLHVAGAAALFALAQRLYGNRAALWAGIGWLLIPGVWLSSAIISTDALLLPLWSFALYATWRWIEARRLAWAMLAGAAIGLGALGKYAMLYFLLGLAVAAAWSPTARRAVLSLQGAAAALVALLIVAPNLLWNAAHDFETVAHTAANANWSGPLLNVGELGDFLADQFAIALLMTVGFCGVAFDLLRKRWPLDERARFLLAFALPPLLIIAAQALISRAHGNWAASAYPAILVLVAGRYAGRGPFLASANAVHAAMFAAFVFLGLNPGVGDRLNVNGKNISQMRAWDETAERIATFARANGPYSAILVDHRHAFFELSYHWREAEGLPPLRIWKLLNEPGNHAEAIAPMTDALDGRVLVASFSDRNQPLLAGDFERLRTLERFETALGRRTRSVLLSEASGFAPAPRDDAFRAHLD